jgi:Ti-type conjugative transfer relaxase TraA
MFTPKKIGAGSVGAAKYYAEDFHREDYYAKGKEPPGVWQGGKSLGLDGTQVESADLERLFQGYDLAGKALVQGAGERHAPGWDMPFSAPKSVSVLWGTADEATRKVIEEVHEKAVDAGLSFVREHSLADASRRGKNGLLREAPGDILLAKFTHGTSRDLDPQLHTHVLLVNVARRQDGSWGALQPDGIYRDAKTVSALYRAELAAGLRERLGLALERDGVALRVVGVEKEVERAFSKRRQAIEAEMTKRGASGLRAAAGVALVTRGRKTDVDRVELYGAWKAEAGRRRFSPEKALEASRAAAVEQEKELQKNVRVKAEITPEARVGAALEALCTEHSTFTRHKLIEVIALQGQGELNAKDLRKVFDASLSHPEIVPLEGRDAKGEALITTKKMLVLEEDLVRKAHEMARDRVEIRPGINPVERGEKAAYRISDEQKAVVEHVTSGTKLTLVQGWAGAGKSFTMAAAREVFEEQGARVVGVAPTGKAADALAQGAGLPATTIDSFLLSKGSALPARGVLLVDEAGMVGSAKMRDLLVVAQEKQARVVLVGDSRQLSPIDAGSPFRVLEREIGSRSLAEIRRQTIGWQRDAVKAFAEGRALEGLAAYRQAGHVITSETGKARDAALIASWREVSREKKTSTLILASSNVHVQTFNEAARAAWKEEGILKGKEHVLNVKLRDGSCEERQFQAGDRLVCTKNDRELSVRNGQFGTVESITDRGQKHGPLVKVQMDDGRNIAFNIDLYPHIEHGYASTVHKAQGSTLDKVFVAHSPGMGRESAYVAMSRHRIGVELHVAKDVFSVDEWTKLNAKPQNAMSTLVQQQALDAVTKAYEEKLARDMAKANEKTMSTEHGIAKDALLDKSIKPQNLEQEPAQETKSARDRSRGRSMGIGF